MKSEEMYQQVFNNLVTYLDSNSLEFQKRNYTQLETKLISFQKRMTELPAGYLFGKLLSDLDKIRLKASSIAEELGNSEKIVPVDDLRTEIRKSLQSFQDDLQEFRNLRDQIFADFEAELNRITDNIKLDFEFLFDRYTRRVGLNIGSKFFDLIDLKDDYEIRTFFLEEIFTCRRLRGDLIELSRTFNGQTDKFFSRISKISLIEQYKTLEWVKLTGKMKPASIDPEKMKEQSKVGSIFSEADDTISELLNKILFSGIINKEETIYELLSEKPDIKNLPDNKLRKYMKKMEQQITEFIKLLNREINTRIDEKTYPVRSYFSKSQDLILEKVFLPAHKIELVLEEIETLNTEISADQSKSNYEVLKDLLT